MGLRIPQVLLTKRDIIDKERERLERKERKALGSGSRRARDEGDVEG